MSDPNDTSSSTAEASAVAMPLEAPALPMAEAQAPVAPPPEQVAPPHPMGVHPIGVHPMAPGPMAPGPMAPGPMYPPTAFGSPYRVPESPELAPFVAVPPGKRPWPVIGPAVSIFAVLLWAFVVVGQFTTSWSMGGPIGQGVAVMLVFVATFAAWIANVRRSSNVAPAVGTGRLVLRSIGIGLLSFLLFVGSLFAATALGAVASRNQDFLIALALVILSTVAALVGPRLTSPVPLARSHGQRVRVVVMWVAGVLVTLVAGVDLAANG